MALDKVEIIDLPKICDPRGNLSFIEGNNHIPFKIERTYWIYDVPGGKTRSGHALRTQEEFIVALSGSFDIILNDGKGNEETFHMARSYYGLHIPPMTWRRIVNFSTNSVAMILSSTKYDANDYIEDFEQFKAIAQDEKCD